MPLKIGLREWRDWKGAFAGLDRSHFRDCGGVGRNIKRKLLHHTEAVFIQMDVSPAKADIMSGSKHGTVHYNLLVVGYLYYTNMLKFR